MYVNMTWRGKTFARNMMLKGRENPGSPRRKKIIVLNQHVAFMLISLTGEIHKKKKKKPVQLSFSKLKHSSSGFKITICVEEFKHKPISNLGF